MGMTGGCLTGHGLSFLLQHMPYSSGSTYVYRAEAGQGEVTSAQFLQGSAISLQSMFSETVSIGFVAAVDDCRASCPRMSVDILGTNCGQCVCTVQCCFTSTETVRLVRTESPGRPPRLSHSS